MNNFIFEDKTKVYFGKGGVKEYLGSLLGNYGETVMLAYGGGSIKRNGVYDEIMGILNAAGKRIVEFDRIMSNPTYAKVQEGAKLARENHVDLILAVGGGSVSDCCKVISAQAKLDEDIWEMQYTGLSEYSESNPPTYACVGDRDGIANWRVMQVRLEAMQQAGIDTEFHVYSGLGHGFGLGTGTSAEGWINDAVAFWEQQMKK